VEFVRIKGELPESGGIERGRGRGYRTGSVKLQSVDWVAAAHLSMFFFADPERQVPPRALISTI
jgi:hypothetical protein